MLDIKSCLKKLTGTLKGKTEPIIIEMQTEFRKCWQCYHDKCHKQIFGRKENRIQL
jgi:hypothetical protein